MKRVAWSLGLVLLLCFTLAGIVRAQPQPQPIPGNEQAPLLVGRISHVEGQLLRYVTEEQDWVATVEDAPFGMNDVLHSDERGKAEILMPNHTWVRTAGNTQIQLLRLEEDLTEIDVASGAARFYNKSSAALIKATTPFGYVMAPALTVFDLYVGDESLEVIALQGKVDFVPGSGGARYEVVAGSSSILANQKEVSSGEGQVDADWEAWNAERDVLWKRRALMRGDSVKYLPPHLYDEAYVLEENGVWERVYYEGDYRYFWRPVRVPIGWAPFTVGRWTVWHREHCWVPSEPFGYLTHHYGNWVFVKGFWYWAPPVIPAGLLLPPPPPLPLLPIPFAWYPGRVCWIYSGLYVGWVVLAPFEPYYCYHRWGPHTVVVNRVNVTRTHATIRNYKFVEHAVIVKQDRFHAGKDYSTVRIPSMERARILNNYRAAPVVDHTVISNYSRIKERHHFSDAKPREKPQRVVINRIQENERRGRTEPASGKATQERVARTSQAMPSPGAQIGPPKARNRLTPADQVGKQGGKAKEGMKSPHREGKHQGGLGASPQGGAQGQASGRELPAKKQTKPDQSANPAGAEAEAGKGRPQQWGAERPAPDAPAQRPASRSRRRE
ncbi:MAG: FecR domain-containing protein [candidate division NC10 bacterium]|nr:FecR domain-containing protein [candidate division NC10 bacterium]